MLTRANLGYHTEINDLLLSALSLALKAVFGSNVHHIVLEGHGRQDLDPSLDVSRTLGWFTTMYPVKLTAFEDIGETMVHTKEMLRQIPSKGIGFGALTQAGLLTGVTLPRMSFNYLGQFKSNHPRAEAKHWQITGEASGQAMAAENTDAMLLNINGAVQNGALQFGIGSRLSAAQTSRFVEAFQTALAKVIQQGQTLAKTGGILTPSDYPVEGLSLQGLVARLILRHLGIGQGRRQ